MNVTELARKLKVNTADLLQILPEFGFGIGKRAIKVDNKVADQVIKSWPRIQRELERRKRAAEEEQRAKMRAQNVEQKRTVSIPPIVTVREFAAAIDRPVNEVIKLLMKSGVLASLNERIDFDTASIVADDIGITLQQVAGDEAVSTAQEKLETLLKADAGERLVERAPVVVVMGHVDHGKTKLLDTIRTTNVIETEAGGITQHIGAYQVEKKGRMITFIDTPGHEAFTAMRSRGARVADIAILVVAADDSIQMQTKEAIKIIQQAKLPMIVAINKIDKDAANIDKVKKDLSELNIIPEEWGGNTICVPISALKGTGIDQLLDAVLLVADMEKEHIMASEEKSVAGTVIESHIDKGEGPVATMLVQRGILHLRDHLAMDEFYLGRVRVMKTFRNENIDSARPSTPVKLVGLKFAPKVGDVIEVISEKERKDKRERVYESAQEESVLLKKIAAEEKEGITKLNVIIRADVLGSLEAITESLLKIEFKDAKVNIVAKGLGNITDSDVLMAESSKAMLIGFHVRTVSSAEKLAKDHGIEILYYKVIYDLINSVRARLVAILPKEVVRTDIGEAKVLAIFKSESKSMIVGAEVTKGKVMTGAKVEVRKAGTLHTTGSVTGVKVGKQEVRDVVAGQQCGIAYVGAPDIAVGDILGFYTEEEKTVS